MGKKADKKVKSDRVNALRKQYDAFLEDDKKRKERNEYILGRLDNMRYSTAAVQIRHKPTAFGELVPVYNRPTTYRVEQIDRRDVQISIPSQQISRPQSHSLQLDVPRQYLDDTSILNEISKKYILIPKLRPSLVSDFVGVIPPQAHQPVVVSLPNIISTPTTLTSTCTNISSNEDWKSKYDILDQLKKKEKEELINKYEKHDLFPVKESENNMLIKNDSKKAAVNNFDSTHGIDGYDLQNDNTKESATKYDHEVPEKDLSYENAKIANGHNTGKSKITNSKNQEPNIDHTQISSASIHNNPEMNTVYDNTLHTQGEGYNTPTEGSNLNPNYEENLRHNTHPEETLVASQYDNNSTTHVYNEPEHQQNENPQEGYLEQAEYPVEFEQPVVDEGKYPDPDSVYLDREDYSPMQVMNSADAPEIPKEAEPVAAKINEGEVEEYPIEMLSVQEFTPKEGVKLVDGVNVNPDYVASEENAEPLYENNTKPEALAQHTEELPPDTSGIEAYDAEQRELFYSEQTEEYAYDQQHEPVGEDYTQEYAPADGYPPAQDYTEAYYENPAALQEQEYPVEVNEHEETDSRYDQNYEQQYEANYEQVQEQQHYDQSAGDYDQTQQQYQEYEYQQPDQETVQNVEQVLDNEQGFVEKQNLEAAEQPAQAVEQLTS